MLVTAAIGCGAPAPSQPQERTPPRIKNGATRPQLKYASEPVTHFKKVLRQESVELVMDHITKNVLLLDLARTQHILKVPGAD